MESNEKRLFFKIKIGDVDVEKGKNKELNFTRFISNSNSYYFFWYRKC